MTRFFVPPGQINEGIATLAEGDVYHLRVVLKASAGEAIAVLDGSGREFPGRLLEIGKTRATVRLDSPFEPDTEPQTSVTVAQALPKMAEKMEQVLQHGTEIGTAGFWAFESERSQTHLTGERQEKRLTRWSSIIKTAAEQSHRALLPSLRVAGKCGDVFQSAPKFDRALLADPTAELSLREALSSSPAPQSLLVIVGPESGFTPAEVTQAKRAGVTRISLGPRILRTETAALALTAQILFALESTHPVC
jgi:16S rRNA (uracil1498-N3)-methyltransferase